MASIGAQFGKSIGRSFEPSEFLFHLFGRGFVSRVGVGGNDRECFALAGFDVGFNPSAFVGERNGVFAASGIGDWEATGNRHPSASFDGTLGVDDVPSIAHEAGDELIGGTHFLKSDDIGLGLDQPLIHAFAGCGAEAIDVDGCDSQHPSIVSRSGFRWGRLAR